MRLPEMLAVGAALFTMFATGSQLGWLSPALPLLLGGNGTDIVLSSDKVGWLITMSYIGRIFGLFGMIYTIDTFGRKCTVVLITIANVTSWLLVVLAPNFYILYVARLLAGLGAGLSYTTIPIYLAEISSDSLRARLSSLIQVSVIFGVSFSYSIVPYVPVKTSSLIFASSPVILMMLLFWMPETPYYLLMRGQYDDAFHVLKTVRGKNVEDEFEHIRMTVTKQMSNKSTICELFKSPSNIKGLVIIMGVFSVQILSGYVSMGAFTHLILSQISKKLPINVIAIFIIFIRFTFSGCSSPLVHRFGKKHMLMVSSFMCSIAMFCFGLYFHLEYQQYDMKEFVWIGVLFKVFFHVAHSLGLAGIPITQLGEFFPANIKRYAVFVCTFYVLILEVTVLRCHQMFALDYGVHIPFYFYSICMLFGLVFIGYVVPETKSSTLHEIQLKLGANYDNIELNTRTENAASSKPEAYKVEVVKP